MNNQFYSKILHDFLNEERFLWYEHEIILKKLKTQFDEYAFYKKSKSKFGYHYTNCAWSNDETTCGPDTCKCSLIDKSWEQALCIMNFYNNLKT